MSEQTRITVTFEVTDTTAFYSWLETSNVAWTVQEPVTGEAQQAA